MKLRLRRWGRHLRWRQPSGSGTGSIRTAQLVDTGVLGALIIGALAPLQPVYGGAAMVGPVSLGLVLGLAVALVGAARRWRVLPLCAAGLVAYGLGGTLFAPPGLAWFGWLPNLAVWRWLAQAALTIWSNLITVAVPVGTGGGFGEAPFLAALVASLGG